MRKNAVHFTLDTIALVAMLALVGTGLLMRYTLPPGSGGQAVWGLGRHDWGGIHFWIAVGLIVLMVVHVTLHWTWVCGTARRVGVGEARTGARRNPRRDNLIGLAFLTFLVVALGGFIGVARASISRSPAPEAEHEQRLLGGDSGGAAMTPGRERQRRER